MPGIPSSSAHIPTSLLFVAVLVVACGSPKRVAETNPVLATAGGVDITRSWFEASYVGMLLHTGANDTPGNRYLHLDNMIDDILLEEEARRRGLHQDPEFIAYEALQTKKVLGSRFVEEAFLPRMAPLSEDEVRVAFGRFKTKVVARHLFFLDAERAEAAYERLQSGRDFLDEAQATYGLAEYDSTAGFLGPLSYFETDDAFAEVAWSLDAGEYSPPVKSRFGYHIIRVENKHISPLITESEFQTRREGIRARAQQRRLRLEGDRFVHEFMSTLQVQVNAEAVAGLRVIVEELENTVGPQAVPILDSEARGLLVSELTSDLTPDTPLVSFVWRGDTYAFTLLDYLTWLPELPFREARHRTAASVGRALRNEVLAMEGHAHNLYDDRTRAEVHRSTIRHLATQLRGSLRGDSTVTPDDAFLREAFERLGYADQVRARATFRIVPFRSLEAAVRAKDSIDEGESLAGSFPGVESFVDQDLQELPDWRVHARTAPVGKAVVVGLSDNRWYVLEVEERKIEKPSFDEFRDMLADQSAPYMAEYRLLERLRSTSDVKVDTTLFEQIMSLE